MTDLLPPATNHLVISVNQIIPHNYLLHLFHIYRVILNMCCLLYEFHHKLSIACTICQSTNPVHDTHPAGHESARRSLSNMSQCNSWWIRFRRQLICEWKNGTAETYNLIHTLFTRVPSLSQAPERTRGMSLRQHPLNHRPAATRLRFAHAHVPLAHMHMHIGWVWNMKAATVELNMSTSDVGY